MNKYYIYIITNRNDNVLYIGETNDLKRRVFEHREKLWKDLAQNIIAANSCGMSKRIILEALF
jgi:predicted GIY-YIG superfamily endonuclease